MIKELLLGIYHYKQRKFQNYHFWKETRSLMAESTEERDFSELPLGKYLVLIPHSDDEWIGNSTLISDNKYQVELFDMDMPGGDSPKLHQIRYSEMKAMANRFNRKLHSKKEGDRLSEVITNYKPDYVTVPFFYDWHPEHRVVMSELKGVAAYGCGFKVVMYQVSVPIANYNITHMNPMDKKAAKRKWNLFKTVYGTQGFFPTYRIACHERINGKIAGKFACEAFCVLGYSQWNRNYDNMIPGEDEIMKLKVYLNSIKDIRECGQREIEWERNSNI